MELDGQNKSKNTIDKDEQRFHKMIEEVQDYAIILLDKDGTILNWNKGAEKIKGYSEREILGRNFSLFYLEEDRLRKLPQQLIGEAERNGRAQHEGWRVRKDGTVFWGYVVITALHDEENNVVGFSKVTRDLTERKYAEDQREIDAQNIALQNKQLEEFAYITSHDLQEPIRKIQTFISIIEEDIDNKEILQKYLPKINSSATKMVNLIRDVLSYSRLSQFGDQIEVVDLNETVKGVVEDFELAIAEKGANITFSNLPTIKGIPVQIKQLFANLISNAIKFNDKTPQIEITSQFSDQTDHSNPYNKKPLYHLITIKDNGIGFEQKFAQAAFQPFKRLTSAYQGTGIGLALCKRILDNHKGKIEVISEPGIGSSFILTFPI